MYGRHSLFVFIQIKKVLNNKKSAEQMASETGHPPSSLFEEAISIADAIHAIDGNLFRTKHDDQLALAIAKLIDKFSAQPDFTNWEKPAADNKA